jgi:hypothetical protein
VSDDDDVVMEDVGDEATSLTLWEERMLRAVQAADSARTGALIIRIVACAAAAAILIGYAISYFHTGGTTLGRDTVAVWGGFLASVAVPVLVALVLFGASYFLEVLASRLDMDMVLNAEEAADGPNRD